MNIYFTVHKNIIRSILFVLLSNGASLLSAQTIQDTIQAYFTVLKQIPQEKIYLHLDKPFYGAGENIWFKGYLIDGLTHKNAAKSNFIITELVSRTDTVLQRKKIRRDSLGFHNAFVLPTTLPAGDYYLRAYTNWMLNGESDFFYSHNLKIGNSIDVTILSTIEYEHSEGDDYVAKIKFVDNMQKPFPDIKVKYRYFEKGKQKRKGSLVTNESGWINIPLSLSENDVERWIEVEFDDSQYIYERTFYIPVFSKDYDVNFFPEGGNMLAVSHQMVAFKAQGADGFSREVNGHLFNSKGDTINAICSVHDGMGRFFLNIPLNESYYAILTSSDGITKRFELPEVQQKGIGLSVTRRRGEVQYEIQRTETTDWMETLFLLAHMRGQLYFFQPVHKQRPYGKLQLSQLPDGIMHFLLVDGNGRPISERLLFVRGDGTSEWQVQTEQSYHEKREKVIMHISAQDVEGKPLGGDFSISITDKSCVPVDTLAGNILSDLLLTSDLKGCIENAGYYFYQPNVETDRNLDLVMLTHGWRRHKFENLLKFPKLDFSNYIEAGQVISGRVKSILGKGIKKGTISLVAPKAGILDATETNENGEFAFDVAFRDTVEFAVQARTKKGFDRVDISVNKPLFPEPANKWPFKETASPLMGEYLVNTREQYYMEGGMRVYNLKEVLIQARKRKVRANSVYAGINEYTIDSERLERNGARTIIDAIKCLPGITSIGSDNMPFVRNSAQPALIVIDDVPYEDSGILDNIQVSDIESMSIIRDATGGTFFGPRGASGVILIMLKEAGKVSLGPVSGITTCRLLGYSEPVEFYHPAYDTPEKRENGKMDYRTTIYWNPSLKLDAAGRATIEYYMPDNTSPQNVVIEGVDKDGKICRFVTTVNSGKK